jgi:long-chain acyl-CoA synthetase
MILRAGENVYSAEVEAAIYELPEVYEAAVFGLSHERLGEEVACAVMLKPGARLSEDVTAPLPANSVGELQGADARRLHATSRLPRNPAGKFLKREMQQRYFAVASESRRARSRPH